MRFALGISKMITKLTLPMKFSSDRSGHAEAIDSRLDLTRIVKSSPDFYK